MGKKDKTGYLELLILLLSFKEVCNKKKKKKKKKNKE
jgi:hypothetical protein